MHAQSFRPIRLLVTPWTVARQAPLSMGFSRQEYWSGLPCPPPGDLPEPGVEQEAPCTFCIAGGFFTSEPLGKPQWPCMLLQMAAFPSFEKLSNIPLYVNLTFSLFIHQWAFISFAFMLLAAIGGHYNALCLPVFWGWVGLCRNMRLIRLLPFSVFCFWAWSFYLASM